MTSAPAPVSRAKLPVVLAVIGAVAVVFLVVVYWTELMPPPAMPRESKVADFEAKLREAGRPLPRPAKELFGSAEGRDLIFTEAGSLEKSGQAAVAIPVYVELARVDHGKSARRLAEIYDRGAPGVDRDYSKSLEWYERARQLGETVETCCRR